MTRPRVEETRTFEIPGDTKGETNQFRSQKLHVNLVGECPNGGGIKNVEHKYFWNVDFLSSPQENGTFWRKDLKYMISILNI